MITKKQEKLYWNILLEILESGINIKYESFQLNSLKPYSAKTDEKLKAYNIFFKSICLVHCKIIEMDRKSFWSYLEKIRFILANNGYTLKIDARSFDKEILESKKSIDFNYFLKV